jgi:hypothetical protein
MSDTEVNVTRAVHDAYPDLRFSTVVVFGLRQSELKRVLRAREASDIETLKVRRDLVESRAACGEALFAAAGFEFPLKAQIMDAVEHGFGEAPVLVKALLRCELLHGVLMGVQDSDAIASPITLDDVGDEGESFEGMRGLVACAPGELVVRDKAGIIAAFFRGPDKRTQVSKKSVNVVFYIFDAPGLGAAFDEAEAFAMDLLRPCAESVRSTRAAIVD